MSASGLIPECHPLKTFEQVSARDRLENILKTQILYGSPMPWIDGNPQATCFTECVWQGLVRHTSQFSCYGLVFNKRTIFEKGGGPALYVRGDHMNSIASNLAVEQRVFVTPFDPEGVMKPGVRLDFLHEREWRLPGDFKFEYSELEYVIVDSIQDAHDIALAIGEQHVTQHQIIPMETYRVISRAWGQA